jgi:hypothetical protein
MATAGLVVAIKSGGSLQTVGVHYAPYAYVY